MELPRRLMDGDAGEWERQVLSSGGLDAPSPHFRRRLARLLGVWVGAAGVTGASAASVKTLGAGLLLKWLASGLIAGVVVGGLSFGVRRLTGGASVGEPTSAPAGRRASGDALPPPIRSLEMPSAAATADLEPPVTATDAPRRSQRPPGTPAPAPAPSAQTRLAVEMAAIDQVRAALAAHDPALATRRLDEYELRYPRGLLAIEAEVLRIEALSARGKQGEVDRRSRRFLAEHPDSPYVGRVRSLLEGKVETSW